MIFLKRLKWPTSIGILVLMIFVACEEDPTTIGEGIIGSDPFTTSKAEFDVFAFNKKIEAVQTNQLPSYQLGIYNDPVFGKTEAQITSQLLMTVQNPTFGALSQSIEDSPDPDIATHIVEEEQVDSVYLYIPYLTKTSQARDSDNDGVDDIYDEEPNDANNDSDGDGISNIVEKSSGTDPLDSNSTEVTEDNPANIFPKRVDLDSIYGNRDNAFTLKVERSTYFLRNLDPSTGFQEFQEYFSTQQFSPAFVSDLLFEGEVTIDDNEILLFTDDDPDTEDIDESKQVGTRLSPGIRIPLDNDFFQENFIDKEGSSDLISQNNFNNFLRGLHISLEQPEQDMLLLLDLAQANITVSYKYKRIDVNGTDDDTSDDEEEIANRDYVFSFLQVQPQFGQLTGNAVNTFNNDPLPVSISDALDTGLNASQIYLRGGAGTYAEIRLFDDDGDGLSEKINQIKANNWIINEANLVFYVNRAAIDDVAMTSGGEDQPFREPSRLYLYKIESGEPLINFATERSTEEGLFGSFLNYDGIVELDGEGKAERYSIKITNHINDLIVRDSLNANLGLTFTSDILRTGLRNAKVSDGDEQDLPVVSALSPLGTVLFGSVPNDQNLDKKLKLEIFYTEAN